MKTRPLGIGISLELTTEHMAAIDYALSHMVREESNSLEEHNYKRKLLLEVLDIAKGVFANKMKPPTCQNDRGDV